ncbi:hypothetical protein F5883DRAFT_418091 [Diaporthe sp. PMI_573]|nr:hypothetical protein F5883DRAFT_418091 [Diaporthaceae sp. PMI_573]
MVAVTLLRGFRVSVSTLDAFLAANGVDETCGAPPFTEDHPDNDAISVLLHSKLGSEADPQKLARVIIPQRKDMNRSTVAYVAYAWVMAYAHREIDPDTDLPPHPPAAFETLRKEILGFGDKSTEAPASEGKNGLFLVTTDEGSFVPEELKKRKEVPQKCDHCDETFDTWDAWKRRQDHRREVHGSSERDDPLPEA